MDEQDILNEVFKLPADKQYEIAKAILASLDDREPEFSKEQMETIKRRIDDIESGEATLIPLSEVKQEMKKRFHSMKNTNEDPPIEGFNAVEWSRQVKRNFAKKWTDENGNPDWEKLKKLLRDEKREQ